jgi:PAS domain S-box-containing protein
MSPSEEIVLFWNSPVAIGATDPDGRILKVNYKMVGLLGYGESELVRKKITEVTHPQDAESVRQSMRAVVDRQRDRYQVIKRVMTKENRVVWVKETVLPVVENNEVKRFFFWVEELPNHGNFKVENDGQEIYVRPAISIPKFVIDNWKWFVGIISTSFLAAAAGWSRIEKLIKFIDSLPQ